MKPGLYIRLFWEFDPKAKRIMAVFRRIVNRIRSSLGRRTSHWLFGTYNEGRMEGARSLGAEFGLISAILDNRTCAFCAWADGRAFTIDTPIQAPPFHENCRCIAAFFNIDSLEEDGLTLDDFDAWEDPPSSVLPPGRV